MFPRLVLRIALILSMSIWWGGLTFYALFVVPTGVDVLGGETEQGFITQRVSNIINLCGLLALALLLVNMAASWRSLGRFAKSALVASWLAMAAAQFILFLTHPRLDALLDVPSHSIIEPSSFHRLHEFYLSVTTAQWSAGLLHLIAIITIWSRGDRKADANINEPPCPPHTP
jgi:hypothetical protein